jgi:hypothetical protein
VPAAGLTVVVRRRRLLLLLLLLLLVYVCCAHNELHLLHSGFSTRGLPVIWSCQASAVKGS